MLSVETGSPAHNAGIQPADRNSGRGGDLIIALNETSIANFSDLNSFLVLHTSAGDVIEVTVLRDGETITIPVTLGRRP